MVDILVYNWVEDWPGEHADPTKHVDGWEDQFVFVDSLEISNVHNLFWIMIMNNKIPNFNLKPMSNSSVRSQAYDLFLFESSIYRP